MSASDLLITLVLGGLMGLLGQGARAVVGLKTMVDSAKTLDVSPSDLFQTARLLTSLLLGFLVGVASAVTYLAGKATTPPDVQMLIGFAAAGYTGVDFLEGFISSYLASPVQSSLSVIARVPLAAVQTPANATEFVLGIINRLYVERGGAALPNNKTTLQKKLSDVCWQDNESADQLRAAIDFSNWHGVKLGYMSIDCSETIQQLIDAVTAAERQ